MNKNKNIILKLVYNSISYKIIYGFIIMNLAQLKFNVFKRH